MKKFGHDETCCCDRCFAHKAGDWFSELGKKTVSGDWDLFVTITYRTQAHPWQKGFPMTGEGRPSPEYGNHFFEYFVRHLEAEMGERVDYIEVDQYGKRGGRFHQHGLLAAPGLKLYPHGELESWLCKHVGYSRVLPFKREAAYYLVRVGGRGMQEAEWRLRLGNDDEHVIWAPKQGVVMAFSAELPKSCFHQCLPRRHR